jgi:hypothetical protein
MPTRRDLALVLLAVVAAGGCGGAGPAPLPAQPSVACALSVTSVPSEGWVHVAVGSTINYAHNPPASGPHYPVWAHWGIHTSAVPRGYWVHNLEHGGIVFLYRPDAPSAVVSALTDTFRALPNDPTCGHPRALLTPDPQIMTPIAVVAANWVLSGDCVDPQAIVSFATGHRGQGPEAICDDGAYP